MQGDRLSCWTIRPALWVVRRPAKSRCARCPNGGLYRDRAGQCPCGVEQRRDRQLVNDLCARGVCAADLDGRGAAGSRAVTTADCRSRARRRCGHARAHGLGVMFVHERKILVALDEQVPSSDDLRRRKQVEAGRPSGSASSSKLNVRPERGPRTCNGVTRSSESRPSARASLVYAAGERAVDQLGVAVDDATRPLSLLRPREKRSTMRERAAVGFRQLFQDRLQSRRAASIAAASCTKRSCHSSGCRSEIVREHRTFFFAPPPPLKLLARNARAM